MKIKAIKHNDFEFQYFFFTISVLLLVIFSSITTLTSMGNSVQSLRYLVSDFFIGLLILLTLPLNFAQEHLKFMEVSLVFLVLARSAYSTYKQSSLNLGINWLWGSQFNCLSDIQKAWQGKTFLLWTEKKASNIDWEELSNFGLYANKPLTFYDYKIFLFSENISKKIRSRIQVIKLIIILSGRKSSLRGIKYE